MTLNPLFMVNEIYPAYSTTQEGFTLDGIIDTTAYILDASGWKIFRRNGVSISLINIDELKGIQKLEERITLSSPKIPLNLIRRVTAFFKKVYDRDKTEAVGYLYYKTDSQEWDFVPPVQTNSHAAAAFGASRPEDAPRKLEDGWKVAGTIHSHGDMTAFHSGVDDKDEVNWDGVHITIGLLNKIPEYSCSVMAQGARAKYNPADLIDGMASMDDVPDEWMAAVKLGPITGINDPKLAKRAEKLYDKYFAGKMTEEDYLKDMKKIEDEDDSPVIDASPSATYPMSSFFDDSRFSDQTNRGWKYRGKR
jgi:proteasome lid subunit RPN8/RPN11